MYIHLSKSLIVCATLGKGPLKLPGFSFLSFKGPLLSKRDCLSSEEIASPASCNLKGLLSVEDYNISIDAVESKTWDDVHFSQFF